MRQPPLLASLCQNRTPHSEQSLGSLARRAGASLLPALAIFIATSGAARAQAFTEYIVGFTAVYHGDVAVGDYDNDDKLDVLFTGQTTGGSPSRTARVYRQGSVGYPTFTNLTGISGNGRSAAVWCDYNRNNTIDPMVTGIDALANRLATLYKNNSGFTAQTTRDDWMPYPFVGGDQSALAWCDYDRDGDQDAFISANGICKFYRNDGASGSDWYLRDMFASITHVYQAGAAWIDWNRDGYPDLLVSGLTSSNAPLTKLYTNHAGVFDDSGINLVNLGRSAVAVGDFNTDGYRDFAISGTDAGGTRRLYIYTNNSGTSFTQAYSLTGFSDGSLAWGDYNNDGRQDLLATGLTGAGTGTPTTKIYVNNGGSAPTDLSNTGLPSVYDGAARWADYDNDGILDIFITGRTSTSLTTAATSLYLNNTIAPPNTSPSTPSSLSATSVSGKGIKITWTAPGDALTPSANLTYNMYVKDNTTGDLIASPMSSTSGAFNRTAQHGSLEHAIVTSPTGRAWTITGLIAGRSYTIGVQSVDDNFRVSGWATTTITTSSSVSDLYIRDCTADLGTEPSNCSVVNNSPDIWTRYAPDGIEVHQAPIAGKRCYVHVKIRRKTGTPMPADGKIYMFWHVGSTTTIGNWQWQNGWSNSLFNGTINTADLIGSVDIPSFTNPYIAIRAWDVPSQSSLGSAWRPEFCLLARYHSHDDPTTGETRVVDMLNSGNVRRFNNLAMRNLTSLPMGTTTSLYTGNYTESTVAMRLDFAVPSAEVSDPVTNHATVTIDLGTDLMQRWVNGGYQGSGVTAVSSTEIQLTSASAYISNLSMDPGERFEMGVRFDAIPLAPGPAAARYGFQIDQYDMNDLTESLGGQTFDLDFYGTDPTRPDSLDHDTTSSDYASGFETSPMGPKISTGSSSMTATIALVLRATPNPSKSEVTISYVLPSAMRVTLAIYDAGGNLVRRLVTDAEQGAGAHDALWDGRFANGTPVPSGAYFYRVETPRGAAQEQVRIVR